MPKDVQYTEELRTRMQAGADRVADAVKATIGPKGRNVLVTGATNRPMATNDGATIAKDIDLDGITENMGAQLLKEIALRTNDLAGDGTTTATVLAQEILRGGMHNLASGANPVQMKKGIQIAIKMATAALQKMAKPISSKEEIAKVAAISAGDPEIGEMIAEAMEKVGTDGAITIKEAKTMETTLKFSDGLQFDRGFISPKMVTDPETMSAELTEPYILLTDKKLSNAQELIPLLDQIARAGSSLLIVCDGMEGEALNLLVVNKVRGKLKAAAVTAPSFGINRKGRMEDLAVLTGGTYIAEELGYNLREVTIDMLGRAASATIHKRSTSIVGGAGDPNAVKNRMAQLRAQIEISKHEFEKNPLRERLSMLNAGAAVIHVGAATEVEMLEKKLRIEDALNAAKSAIAEGIVPGGGTAYLMITPILKKYIDQLDGDMKTGATLILKALEAPARQIAENAGLNGGAVVAEVLGHPAGYGFNALTGEYVDMLKAGIIDPAKVTRLALRSAASISAVFLTTEAAVVNVK